MPNIHFKALVHARIAQGGAWILGFAGERPVDWLQQKN
jgi:hypothetical protein